MKSTLLSIKYTYFTYLIIIMSIRMSAQVCESINLEYITDIDAACSSISMTMQHDVLDRPYLYIAQKEGGLVTYDISDIENPVFTSVVNTSVLSSKHVMNITQQGNYLYLALGNFFGASSEAPGMAIVDMTYPSTPVVTDVWVANDPGNGTGIVKVEGNYAYLGAMGEGVIVLDISDKNNISFVSQFIPDIDFPVVNQDEAKVNARGMIVRNDTIFLAYDAGGFRIIDASIKTNLVEVGMYSNSLLDNQPRAYNNVEIEGTLAYITIDYCGMEILDFSTPSNIQLIGWWNPWNCPGNNWFASVGHTNEIALDAESGIVFMSTGKSDMYVVDVSDPTSPDSCFSYGGVNNNIGTWGVSRFNDKVFLSYICTLGIPFASNWSGVKAFTYDNVSSFGKQGRPGSYEVKIYPNPALNEINIETNENGMHQLTIQTLGGQILNTLSFKGKSYLLRKEMFNPGIYILEISNEANYSSIHKLIIH